MYRLAQSQDLSVGADCCPRSLTLQNARWVSRHESETGAWRNEFLQAQEAVAVTIVGNGNDRNNWNGYSEVELCTTSESPGKAEETEIVELPFPAGRKGFNIVNRLVNR